VRLHFRGDFNCSFVYTCITFKTVVGPLMDLSVGPLYELDHYWGIQIEDFKKFENRNGCTWRDLSSCLAEYLDHLMEFWDDPDFSTSVCLRRYHRAKAATWGILKAQVPWRRKMTAFNVHVAQRLEEYGDVGDQFAWKGELFLSCDSKYIEAYTAELELP
jgi:hypothetical protein